jgi:glycogen debranching enzyme
MSGWNVDTRAQTAGLGAVTVVEGSAFCVSGPSGDIETDRPHGFFFRDTRLVSDWKLLINGVAVEPLSTMTPQPYRAIFIGRAGHLPDRADTPLLVERERRVGTGMREDITLTNFSQQPVDCTVEFRLEADFADIFDVKEGKPRSKWEQSSKPEDDRLIVESVWRGEQRGLTVLAPSAKVSEDRLEYLVTVPAQGTWSRTINVTPTIEGEEIAVGFPTDLPLHDSEPERRLSAWYFATSVPTLDDEDVEKVIRRSQKDLGSLRIFDRDHPDRAVVAAGAPWFMALFGRDSLLTSLMALPVDPSLALGTLQTLADLQGSRVNPLSEEQPGKILHEVRLGANTRLALGGGSVYYGTVDATPLFVVVLGELVRWGLANDELDSLLPHATLALDWIDTYGDRDGDGFVEYARLNDQGLINQGWKDSWDGITFADGTLATGPMALCEVQGYVYSAFLSRALIAHHQRDHDAVTHWVARAQSLKTAFNERFWMPDRGYFAVALDGGKRQVDALASNMGHCLWSGIIDDDKAAAVAERLMSPEMFSGWGVRTLASNMGAYNPASYHNGTIWPHDNALIAAGLMRYGFVDEATKLAVALFDAADHFEGRLPELFCGFDRDIYPQPIPYPTSCSPQAWAAATPFSLIRTLLRLDPCVPTGDVWLSPVLPQGFGRVRVENVPIAGSRITVEIDRDQVTVSGLPSALTLHREPRPVSADLVDLVG